MRSRPLIFRTALLGIVLLGAALRCANYRPPSPSGLVNFVSSDCLYHMRRARFAVAHFPKTIILDPAINFPAGGLCIWPPLFDLTLALPALLLHGAHATTFQIEHLAAWVPIGYAAGALVLMGLLAGSLQRRWALPAALFLALCPGHILYSRFAETDQHVAESFWGLLVVFCFWRAEQSGKGRARWKWELGTGLALLAAVSTWQGGIFWAPLLAAALLPAFLVQPDTQRLRTAALLFLVPFLLMTAEVAAFTRGYNLPFTYVSFGEFQPAFLALAATGAFSALTAGFCLARKWRPAGVSAAFAAASGLTLLRNGRELIAFAVRGAGHLATQGSSRLTMSHHGLLDYSPQWLAQVFENRPLFADGILTPVELLSLALFLLPLVILLWLWRARRTGPRSRYLFLGLWGALTLFMTISQRRNVYYAAPLCGLVALEAATFIAVSGRKLFSRCRIRPAGTFAAVALLLALPMAWGIAGQVKNAYGIGNDLDRTLTALRAHYPRTFDIYDARFLTPAGAGVPGLARAEGVMAPWSLGHLLTYRAEVPVVAGNFGYGFDDMLRFYFAEDEGSALAIARARHVRYVIGADLLPKLNDYGKIVGHGPYWRMAPAGPVFQPEFFRTIQARLYDFDGKAAVLAGGTRVEPLPHFRLIYSSQTGHYRFGRVKAQWKVFEIVQ